VKSELFSICDFGFWIARSSDNSIGSGQDVGWNGYSDLLGGFEIDHQLEFSRLLDRKVGRFCAFEDLIDVSGGSIVEVANERPVGH